jgi:TonB family protein
VSSSPEALISICAALVFGCASQPNHPAPLTLTNEACHEGGTVAEAHEVRLSIDLGADGKVKQIEVIRSGGPDYDTAALDALKRTVFSPAMRGGVPVPCRFSYTYRFNLCRDP